MKCIYSKCKHGSVIYSNHDDVEIFPLNTTVLETVSVIVKETLIVSVYVAPATSWTLIADDIKSVTRQINSYPRKHNFSKILIIGDFNLDVRMQTLLAKMLLESGLHQMVTEPTHELGSILDLAFTNHNDTILFNKPVWFSDHHIITVHLK